MQCRVCQLVPVDTFHRREILHRHQMQAYFVIQLSKMDLMLLKQTITYVRSSRQIQSFASLNVKTIISDLTLLLGKTTVLFILGQRYFGYASGCAYCSMIAR